VAKAGRPTKYKPEYCELLIEHMKAGLSFEAFGGVVAGGVAKDTIYGWVRKYPAFSDAKKIGESLSRLWWEKVAVLGMTGKIKNFNATVWIFSMKNRFGWRDLVQNLDEQDGFEFTD
jgi:transposase